MILVYDNYQRYPVSLMAFKCFPFRVDTTVTALLQEEENIIIIEMHIILGCHLRRHDILLQGALNTMRTI